ncbi:hypothetical protein [Endozoicomonas lisbonensis]|uniref:Uncharacterized protein n=1 Tax=Endozoicomonas lisbonensis TaxID=3120522 RepID=A0ABV2SJ89_9GAMM
MKKVISGIVASAALAASFSAVAIDTLPAEPQARFRKEVVEMTQVMGLNQEQADAILKLKADLFKSNRNAQGREERQKNMQDYQKHRQAQS